MKREPEGTVGHSVKALAPEVVTELLQDFKFKTVPFDHQKRALIIGVDQPAWLYALDMGTGKTKLSLDLIYIHRLLEGCERGLIIAPPFVLKHWKKQAGIHSDMSITIVDGDAKTKRELFQKAKTDLVVVSMNWITRLFGEAEKAREKKDFTLDNWLHDCFLNFDALIIDEVHSLKNPLSVGFKGFKRYSMDVPFRYLMTGTPIGNDYIGIWSLYYLIDGGETFGTSYTGFLSYWFDCFIVERWVKGRKVRGFPRYTLKPARKEQFMKKFWSKMVRWEEGECNTLPPKSYVQIPLDMTAEQWQAYDQLLEDFDGVGSIDFDLMRITAGIGMKHSPKLDALLAIIEEVCILNGQQLIVWHWLDDEGKYLEDAIAKNFKKLRFAPIRGSTSKKNGDKALEAWHDRKLDLILANVKSLGIGVDLWEANKQVFYSNNRSIIDRKQAEKRIHRTGQLFHCTYFDLICDGTIDQVNLDILGRAAANFKEITKDAGNEPESEDAIPDISITELRQQREAVRI